MNWMIACCLVGLFLSTVTSGQFSISLLQKPKMFLLKTFAQTNRRLFNGEGVDRFVVFEMVSEVSVLSEMVLFARNTTLDSVEMIHSFRKDLKQSDHLIYFVNNVNEIIPKITRIKEYHSQSKTLNVVDSLLHLQSTLILEMNNSTHSHSSHVLHSLRTVSRQINHFLNLSSENCTYDGESALVQRRKLLNAIDVLLLTLADSAQQLSRRLHGHLHHDSSFMDDSLLLVIISSFVSILLVVTAIIGCLANSPLTNDTAPVTSPLVAVERSVRRLQWIICTLVLVSLIATLSISALLVDLHSAQDALHTEIHYLNSQLVGTDLRSDFGSHRSLSGDEKDISTGAGRNDVFNHLQQHEEQQKQHFQDVSDRVDRLETLIASSTASSFSGGGSGSCASNLLGDNQSSSSSSSHVGEGDNGSSTLIDDTYALVNQLNSRVNQLSNQYNVLANAQLASLGAEVRQMGSRHDSLKAEVYALSKHVAEEVRQSFVKLFDERFSALDESFIRQLNEQMAGMDKYVIGTLNDQVVTLNAHMSTYIDREVVALDNNLVKQLNAQMRAMDLYVVDLINTQVRALDVHINTKIADLLLEKQKLS